MNANAAPPLLQMQGITKRFGSVTALAGVDFAVERGEIHALLGQNGAGKSTLMKILAGVYPVDDGTIAIEGAPVTFSHPRDALRRGIGTVYQDLSLVPHLSVAENIFLGREPGGFVIREGQMMDRAARLLTDLGVRDIEVRQRVSRLPLAQQQLVEIAKVLSHEPRLLILDEPTAALAEDETALLFGLLHGLRDRGIAIIFISHRFNEVLAHCERATVLRNGERVATIPLAGVSEQMLIELTIGARIADYFHHEPRPQQEAIALQVEGLSVGRAVRDVSFGLRRGQIAALTGLLGAGQNEVARALFGIQAGVSGLIRRDGIPLLITSPTQAIRHGIGLLTEDRKREGLILDLGVRANITLPSLWRFRRAGPFIDNRREQEATRAYINQIQIKTPGLDTRTGALSGGNQQKVILARWLLRDLDILIFISPTQGIDVGAKAEIYQQLNALARAGKAILVISEDLIEVLGIADRILVMYRGRLSQTFERGEGEPRLNEETLLAAIQGQGAAL